MTADDLRALHYQARAEVIAGWSVRVVSYRIGDRWFASVASADAEAQIARAEADSQEQALSVVRHKAAERLSRSKRL